MRKIGLDFDGVIADSLPLFIEFLNQQTGKDFKLEDIKVFNPVPVYCTKSNYFEILENFNHYRGSNIMLKPLHYSNKYLGRLWPYNELHIVTCRSADFAGDAHWLNELHTKYDSLTYVENKAEHLKTNSVDIFVEDCLEQAIQIATVVPTVYLMDAPHNQISSLPPNITRVKDWTDLYARLTLNTSYAS